MYQQEPPFSVQIEMTEGCNLRCSFCGINGIREKERTFKYMTLENAQTIASNLASTGWNFRLEFAMHGEPTQNRYAVNVIEVLRHALPKNYFLMETNGSGFLGKTAVEIKSKIDMFFKAGLNTIALDEYVNVPWGGIVRGALQKLGTKYYEYPKDPEGNPHTRTKNDRFVIVAPIDTASHGTHSTLNNHCGAGGPLDLSKQHKRCAKPFRELSIRWDGSIALCCNDWRGEFKVGNACFEPIKGLWQHERFQAARRHLLYKQRDFQPCQGCSNVSYRNGLLPDKFGKETLPAPDDKTRVVLLAAVAGDSYTTPVARPWESVGRLVQLEKAKPVKLI